MVSSVVHDRRRFLPVRAALALTSVLGLGLGLGSGGETAKSPYKIQVKDEKAVVVDAAADGPIDPTPRLRFQQTGNIFMFQEK